MEFLRGLPNPGIALGVSSGIPPAVYTRIMSRVTPRLAPGAPLKISYEIL